MGQALPVPVRFTKDSVHEGQTLLLSGYYPDRPKEVKVTWIGRTIMSVDLNGVDARFDMATGRSKRDYRLRIGTVAHYADDLRRIDIRRELKTYGIEIPLYGESFPTWKLEKILKVLAE